MKIIGLTGGIGSGKTTIAKFFAELGVPIYIADEEAKKLTNRSKVIRRKITKVFGEKAYLNNELNRPYIASIVFSDNEKLSKLNDIIHPRVARHFEKWLTKQDASYIIKEAAILFENGGYKKCDKVILVTAPKTLRMNRVLARDAQSKDEIQKRMDAQWSDDKKIELADIVIENTILSETKSQVYKIHQTLLK